MGVKAEEELCSGESREQNLTLRKFLSVLTPVIDTELMHEWIFIAVHTILECILTGHEGKQDVLPHGSITTEMIPVKKTKAFLRGDSRLFT